MTEQQHYFAAVEAAFLSVSGTATLLRPADWQTVAAWHRLGVPISLIDRTMRDVLRQRAERGDHSRVSSLRYFERAIQRAHQEAAELQAAAACRSVEEPGIDVAARLAALAAAIPNEVLGADQWRGRVLAVGELGDVGFVEDALGELDGEFVDAVAEAIEAGAASGLWRETDAALRRMAGRGIATSPELERRIHRRRVQERMNLPTLSLFSESIV